MKVGDLVRWIGYPGATSPVNSLGGGEGIGIVLEVGIRTPMTPKRYDVLWSDGSIGRNLYAQTIEEVK